MDLDKDITEEYYRRVSRGENKYVVLNELVNRILRYNGFYELAKTYMLETNNR